MPKKKSVVSSRPVKKSATKKTTKPKAKKVPVRVVDDKKFWLRDGRTLGDIRELCDALKDMDEEVFHHHVGEDRNDFSCWVKDVLCDEKCAIELASVATPSAAHKIVVKHAKQYK